MANLITQVEMMKYQRMEQAVFPVGTILTPSAKDWAKDHGIKIVIGESNPDKDMLLETIIKAVANNVKTAGGFLKKEEYVDIVTRCLTKLGCRVD